MTARDQRGGATLEIVILAPFLLLLMMLILAFARFAQSESVVDQAARDGARAATAQNSRDAVDDVVHDAAMAALDDAPSSCRESAVIIAQPSEGAYGLTDAHDPLDIESVTVTVRCQLSLVDLAALPIDGVTVERTFTSPLDKYRGYEE